MTTRTITTLAVTLLCILLTAGVVWAMTSTNYRLDWFTPLNSSGGGVASSTNYSANFSVGQTAIGTSSSTNYGGCLGYWCRAATEYKIYLPLMLKNH